MPGTLRVQLLRGHRLRDAAFFGVQDPYVLVKLGGDQKKSGVCRDGGVTPVWDETLTFSIRDDEEKKIMLIVKNKGLIRNDLIGTGEVDLTEVLENGQHKLRAPLQTKGNRVRGELELVLLYESKISDGDDESDVVSGPARRDRDMQLPVQYMNRPDQAAQQLPAAYPPTDYVQDHATAPRYPVIQQAVDYPCVANTPPPIFPSSSMGSVEQSFNALGIADEVQYMGESLPPVLPPYQDTTVPIGTDSAIGGYVAGYYSGYPLTPEQNPYVGPLAAGETQSTPQTTNLQDRYNALLPPGPAPPTLFSSGTPGIPLQDPEGIRDDELIV